MPSLDVQARAKTLYPGWIRGGHDPIGSAWRAWKAGRDEPLRDPDAAYLGFAHKWVQEKIRGGLEPESCRRARMPSEAALRWWKSLSPRWRSQFLNMVQERHGRRVVFKLKDNAIDQSNLIRLAHDLMLELEAG